MSTQLSSMPKLELKSQDLISTNWNPVCYITYNRDSWVRLNQAPSAYSDEEALLLCEESPGAWVAWVPGYGEILLDKSEFYC
jgi:hypothetical protein